MTHEKRSDHAPNEADGTTTVAAAELAKEGMHSLVFACDCHALFHVARLSVFKREQDMPHECYLTIRLQRPRSFWRRLSRAFWFVFRPAGFYGEYEEFIVNEATGRKLRDGFAAFLGAQ